MQTSVPGLLDFSDEPKHVMNVRPQVNEPEPSPPLSDRSPAGGTGDALRALMHSAGTSTATCSPVGGAVQGYRSASAALVKDLNVWIAGPNAGVWGGEFGRTPFGQGRGEAQRTRSLWTSVQPVDGRGASSGA